MCAAGIRLAARTYYKAENTNNGVLMAEGLKNLRLFVFNILHFDSAVALQIEQELYTVYLKWFSRV